LRPGRREHTTMGVIAELLHFQVTADAADPGDVEGEDGTWPYLIDDVEVTPFHSELDVSLSRRPKRERADEGAVEHRKGAGDCPGGELLQARTVEVVRDDR